MNRKLHLLIIDPQNDFCDLPTAYYPAPLPSAAQTSATTTTITPALPVPGAHADMQRLAHLISAGGQGLSGISITLDSHHVLDIAHPGFWQQADGSAMNPFTPISAAQVRAGMYAPRLRDADTGAGIGAVLAYLDPLEANDRYTLMVWPQHCVIGSWGHNVHADLHAACQQWQLASVQNVNYIAKGRNPWTEHYSAIQAEVPIAGDPETGLNHALLAALRQQDRIYIAGEAGSHCVKATVLHLIEHLGSEHIGKLVLLTDCISPVSGFETQYQDFIATCRAEGVQIAASRDILPELVGNI